MTAQQFEEAKKNEDKYQINQRNIKISIAQYSNVNTN